MAVYNYMPAAAVGSIPSPWNLIINTYCNLDIILLAVFYNNSFNIEVDDSIDVRWANLAKFISWLVEDVW